MMNKLGSGCYFPAISTESEYVLKNETIKGKSGESDTEKKKVEAENETFFSRGEIAWIAPSCTFLRSEESPDVSEGRPCGRHFSVRREKGMNAVSA